MKLAVMADLHVDLIPGGRQRLEAFYAAAQEEKAHIIINLGDFAAPKQENKWVAELWRMCPMPHLMVLGNHDMDESDKSKWMQFYGMERSYDTVIMGGVQFILLDTNYFNMGGICYDYAYRNYFDKAREFVGAAQQEWLREVLENADSPCVLLSHEGLENVGDKEEVMQILRENRDKIVVCINGHNHVDGLTIQEGIHFLDIVSMTQQWVGSEYDVLTEQECEGVFTKEEFQQYPCLKFTAPYQEPLYEFVEIDMLHKSVSVWGTKSRYIGRSPEERGHCGNVNGVSLSTGVQKKSFVWGEM